MSEKKRTTKTKLVMITCAAVMLCGLFAFGGAWFLRHRSFPEMPRSIGTAGEAAAGINIGAKTGKWYRVTPLNGFEADGTGWHGVFRKGTENKLLVYFFGGGVSINEETEKRYEEFFKYSYEHQDYYATQGIGSDDKENAFRDWTIIGIPYSTGDLHLGTGKYTWKAKDGTEDEICHYGYLNYEAVMKEALRFVGEPEELLITGFSAGGFGAALLADDVIDHFPSVKKTTVCIDSSLLLYDGWKKTAGSLWKAPDKIMDQIQSDNLVIDGLTHLKEEHPDVTILYTGSVRDNALTVYQSYVDNGKFGEAENTPENGTVYQNNLKEMVSQLQEKIPDCGIFIFDLGLDKKTHNTQHMIINSSDVFKPLSDDVSVMKWIKEAEEGKVKSHGLELLDQDYVTEEEETPDPEETADSKETADPKETVKPESTTEPETKKS